MGECDYRIYCDDGKSGKDVIHRPAFMQMMSDAREELISRIIVKKYDCFSRNMREYLNITDELDRYGVTVYSLSEPFNTETKEGRMMRNNLLNFAEFERETIAARVADAFQTKAKFTLNGCPTPPIQLKPRQVEDAVLKEMQKRIEQLKIAKREDSKPDTETESIKTEIIRIDSEIQKLMEKLADADSVLFDYIQKRVSALHEQKSEFDKKMQTMCRKRKAIDTKPLEEPMKQWDKLTVQEKHDIAAAMIDVVLISDETGIEVKFSI